MVSLSGAQNLVLQALGVGALVLQVFALVDALRRRTDAYAAAGKLTKTKWTLILAVATAVGFVSLLSPLNFLNVAAVVAAGVYLADVRPALQRVQGSGRGGASG